MGQRGPMLPKKQQQALPFLLEQQETSTALKFAIRMTLEQLLRQPAPRPQLNLESQMPQQVFQ
jgi:hypothetical protein